jgi:small GTP-binding protein
MDETLAGGLPPPQDDARRCGFVALIGAPNAGKSTLTNALVGAKVTIVSRKVQTTRALVRGIAMVGDAQLVLIDTPGIFAPRRRLDRAMVTTAWGGAHDADIVVLLIDAKKGIDEEAEAILEKLGEVRQPKALVLNKIDLVEKPALLRLAARAARAVALPGGSDFGRADAQPRGGDHPRKIVQPAAPGVALSGDRRDRGMEGIARR